MTEGIREGMTPPESKIGMNHGCHESRINRMKNKSREDPISPSTTNGVGTIPENSVEPYIQCNNYKFLHDVFGILYLDTFFLIGSPHKSQKMEGRKDP